MLKFINENSALEDDDVNCQPITLNKVFIFKRLRAADGPFYLALPFFR
jgi:hypothetical protein